MGLKIRVGDLAWIGMGGGGWERIENLKAL